MRRSTMLLLLFVGLFIVPATLLAQEEIPSVTGTASDEAIEFPAEVPAGLVNLTFENSRTEVPYSPLIARLNDGVSMDAVLAAEETEDPFDTLFLVTLYGGSEVAPGESLSYATELIPGEYILVEFCEGCDDSELRPFVAVEGDMMEQTEPEADITLAMVDFAFGVPAQISAGPQVWHLQNFGEQWHEVAVFKVEEGTTTLDVRDTLMSIDPESGEMPPYIPSFFWAPTGADTQAWVTIDLEPGTYAVSCFLPDLAGDFSPHLAHGMVQVFTVE